MKVRDSQERLECFKVLARAAVLAKPAKIVNPRQDTPRTAITKPAKPTNTKRQRTHEIRRGGCLVMSLANKSPRIRIRKVALNENIQAKPQRHAEQ